ncbi:MULTISPECIES: helix-turn-helix domain-containing protein [Roseobacteraceae]|uniref:Helix-turn-helix domain protein n=1 Tax=Pseudosulfitobacter pseudonitzschiae TaxID=1402135 RepID=A0A221K571_9RHOB|nr:MULTISPECIES: helix-turn-helix transcriptional regulator [Roseobacteraceae]ASM74126.1 helix-turn-helix domain protein [Pseudosulfitobacter pseudonitzschiae]
MPLIDNIAIGTRLSTLRQKENLSQGEMAAALGVSVAAYRNYEWGNRETPVSVLAKAAEMAGTTIDSLVLGEVGLSSEAIATQLARIFPHLGSAELQAHIGAIAFLLKQTLSKAEFSDRDIAEYMESRKGRN